MLYIDLKFHFLITISYLLLVKICLLNRLCSAFNLSHAIHVLITSKGACFLYICTCTWYYIPRILSFHLDMRSLIRGYL